MEPSQTTNQNTKITCTNNALASIPAYTTLPAYFSAENAGSIWGTPVLSSAPTSYPWKRNKSFTFNTATANLTGIVFINIGGYNSNRDLRGGLMLLLTTPQTKTNLQTMHVIFGIEWDRNLVN